MDKTGFFWRLFWLMLPVFWLGLLPEGVMAASGINRSVNFQGKVVNLDGTNVADGNYNFEFSLWTTSEVGTSIWSEVWNGGSSQVAVTSGIFSVNLGTYVTFPSGVDFNSDSLYLAMSFNGDTEMSPRIRLTAVPYAFNAEKVGGLTVTNTTGTLTIPNGKTISFGDGFTTTGVGITLNQSLATGDTVAFAGLSIGGSVSFTNLPVGTGTTVIYLGSGGNLLAGTLPTGGQSYTAINGLNLNGTAIGLGGSMTQNTQIGTSNFGLSFLGLGGTQALFIGSSGYVGVGTTNPGATLQIGDYTGTPKLRITGGAINNGTGYADLSIGDYGELTFGGNYTIFMVEKAFKVVNDQNFVLGSGNEWHWTNNSSTVRLELTDNDNNLFLTVKDQGSSANFSFNSGQMFLDASGALGLGTTNPGKKLDIVGDINLSGTVFVGGGGIGVGNTGSNGQVLASNGAGGLQWTTPGGATYYANNGLNMSGTTVGLGGSLIQNTQIGTSSFGLSFLGLGGSKALYIGSNGKVGVGTTDLSVTSAVLTVKGDLDISGSLIYGGSPVWWVYGDTDVIFRLPSGGGTFKFLDSNNQTLLTMLEDVGIGIGTTDPKYDLDVVGNGHFSGALGVGGTVVLTGLVKGVGTSMVYIDSSGNLMAGTLPLIANDKTIILSPEYAGASLSADGSGTTAVSMTSDNTLNSGSVGWKNYYQLSSAESSLQDYSVLVRVTLPSDFNSWQTGTCPGSSCALEINYQTGLATTADNFISAKVTNDSDTPGSEVCSIGSTASTSWSSSGCASTTLDDGAAPEWDAAGETVVIRLKLGAKNTSNALTRVGDIILRYKSKF